MRLQRRPCSRCPPSGSRCWPHSPVTRQPCTLPISRRAARARRLLRPYLAAARIPGVVQTERSIWARGDHFYGQDALHILSVRVAGRHAFVHECDNTSSMGLASAATGQAVPGSAGISAANLVTRLDLVGGHWLVDSQLPEDVPCVP